MHALIERPRALAIDDHPVNRLLIARQLESLGFDVDAIAAGDVAVSCFAEAHYAVVVLDCAMPGMDGFEIARRIRDFEKRSKRDRTLVVACTAGADTEVERRCIAAGMDDCLAKPSSRQAFSACFARQALLLRQWSTDLIARGGDTTPTHLNETPIDIRVMAENFGADEIASYAMLKDFVAINAEDLRALQAALVERDARAVARCAHRVLGASKMVGATTLARIAARLEVLARVRDWSRIAAVASVLDNECRRVERFVATSVGVSDR